MKDQVFSGRDVADALAAASRVLGLAADTLRYVVLERGAPGVLGMGGTPARIAVLLDSAGDGGDHDHDHQGGRGEPGAVRGPGGRLPEPALHDPAEPRSGIRRAVRALAEAGHLDLEVGFEEDESSLRVCLAGPGTGWLLERDAEVLTALEHLLQRMFGRHLSPRRLILDAAGYRETRDQALRALAQELAAAVRTDGVARTTDPLNAYERRIIHLTLAEEAGVRSFSVGEGGGRRVTVAPADTAGPAGTGAGGA
jgi:spoIIIJ-associated protein